MQAAELPHLPRRHGQLEGMLLWSLEPELVVV